MKVNIKAKNKELKHISIIYKKIIEDSYKEVIRVVKQKNQSRNRHLVQC